MKKKLLKSTLATLLVTTSAFATETGNIFIGTTLGYTHLNVEQSDKVNSMILLDPIDEQGYNFELSTGYHISESIALSLNYQRVVQEDTYQNNTYLQGQYQFEVFKNIKPFIGANLGYSQLKWSQEPINTTDNDYASSSWLAGATLGVIYPMTKSIDFLGQYSLNLTDHKAQLEVGSAKSELQHKQTHNFNFGIRVCF